MVSSFRQFLQNREGAPQIPNQRNYAQILNTQNREVHHPNKNFEPFHESVEAQELRELVDEVRKSPLSASGYRGSIGRDDFAKREATIRGLEKEAKSKYDARVNQRVTAEGAVFKGLSGRDFNANEEDYSSFLIREKLAHDREIQGYNSSKPVSENISNSESEFLFYNQLLQKNNQQQVAVSPRIVNGQAVTDWEEKTKNARSKVIELLTPIEVGGSKTKILGYQKEAIAKATAGSRARKFAGKSVNPLSEDFLPVVASQAVFGGTARLATEPFERAGIISPETGSKIETGAAVAGEFLGFGIGLGSVARSARWMADDIMLPWKVVRGAKKWATKKYGQRGFRTSSQKLAAATDAGKAPESTTLTPDEAIQQSLNPTEYAAQTVGALARPATDIRIIEPSSSGKPFKVSAVFKGEGGNSGNTTYFTINSFDDYYQASGKILGMSDEQIAHASKVSSPIVEGIANLFNITKDEYLKAMLPEVRKADMGKNTAAQTIVGGADRAFDFKIGESIFRRVASIVEYAKTNPDLVINEADAFISIQHELSHVILQDVFAFARYGATDNNVQLKNLADSLKNQVILRQQVTGEPLTLEQISIIKNLSPDDVARLIDNDHRLGMSLLSNQAAGIKQPDEPLTWLDENLLKELDLGSLLHESGAELFSRHLINVGSGKQPASSIAKGTTGEYDLDLVWKSATKSLSDSFDLYVNYHISRGRQPLGVARQATYQEQTTLRKFARVLDDIAKEGKPLEGSTAASADKAAEKIKYLTDSEANDVAIILARATAGNDIEAQGLATFFLEPELNIFTAALGSTKFDIENLSTLTAEGIQVRSNSLMTPWGLHVHNDNHFKQIMSLIREGYPASEIKALAEVGLITEARTALRRTLIVTVTSPETKLLSLHDISRPARSKLSIVDADSKPLAPLNNWADSNAITPFAKNRLNNLAFVNEAGEPIIFMTGVRIDYKADFKHALSNMFGNIAGTGKYSSTLDVAAWSYADDFNARVQAFIPLIHPEEVISMELIGTADRLGAKFIDAGLNDAFVNKVKNDTLKLAQQEMDFGPSRYHKDLAYGIDELKKLQKPVDFTPVDVEEVFGTNVLSDLYDDFAEQIEIITREESAKAVGDDFDRAAVLEYEGLSSVWDNILTNALENEASLGVNVEEFVVIKAATRAVLNKAKTFLADAEKTKTATNAQRKAVERLTRQNEVFQALSTTMLEEVNMRNLATMEAANIPGAKEVPEYAHIDDQLIQRTFEIANAMMGGGTNNFWQVVKSSSMNNIPVIAEIDELKTGSDLASYVIHRGRNRQFIRNIHDSLDPANDYWLNVYEEYTEIQAVNRLNKMYAANGVGAITEVGGTVTGGAPHRVLVLVGSDEVIKSKVLFVATDAKATAPQLASFRKKHPQGGSLDNLTNKAELEVTETKHGRSLVENEQQLINLNTDVIQRAIDQKIVATTRAVASPAAAVEDRLDLLRKAVQGNVIPRQPNNPVPNLSPPKVNFRKYFGDGVAEPINARILEEVLGDTTGRLGRIDGNMTEEGEDYIATNLIPEIEKRINSEEFKVWRETTDAEISAARTKTAARSETARETRQASSDPVRGYEIEDQAVGGALKSQADKSKSGYKPLRLHPMEVVALINYGERNLPNIKNAKLKTILRTFDRTTYRKAIQKLLGVETPFVGSTASTKLKTGTEPQRFVAGMSGTTQLDVAEVLTPSEVTLIWEALGLSTKGRDVPPRTKWQILRSLIVQALNTPRAILLSIDYGAIFNQGGLLIGGAVKPVTTRRSLSLLAKGEIKDWATGPDTQWYQNIAKSSVGMFTARNYDAQMKTITNDSGYARLNKFVFISDLNGPLAQREEAFLGNLFNSVGNVFPDVVKNNPFMQKTGAVLKHPARVVGYPFKAGERFHNLYLNKMRYELLNDYYKTLQNSNVPDGAIDEYLASYGNFLNKATGRGSLPDNLGPGLSTVLLAPRWMTSRFQVPFTVMKTFGKEAMQFKPVTFKETEKAGGALRKANAHAKKWELPKSSVVKTTDGYKVEGPRRGAHTSKQMGADLARTFGVLGGITTLLTLNGFDVETDWRKSNFLKIQKGRVNIDLTLGLGSVWRFMARAAYGKASGKEVTSMGDEFDADLSRQIGNFVRAKLSPLGASIVGFTTDKNFFGEEVTGREQFIPGQSTDLEDFYPLMIQQIQEASEQLDGGFAKTLLGIGAASGLNVSIYADKNDLSQELAGVDYKELYGYEQKYINRMYYEGSEFQPSEYTQTVYEIELQQYREIETIMAGGQSNGDKAKSIYALMNRYDAEVAGVRRLAFDDSNEFDVPEGQPLKQAQNEYYEFLDELYSPENDSGLTSEEIGEKLDSYLEALTSDERDYIIANKSNFMIPDSLFRLRKSSKAEELRTKTLRDKYIRQNRPVPAYLKAETGLYAVAQRVIESNEARDRLSRGRELVVPSPSEQIELTEVIATR